MTMELMDLFIDGFYYYYFYFLLLYLFIINPYITLLLFILQLLSKT